MNKPAVPRRQLILEALANELEGNPGGRVTTARLAQAAGVSEAALYRHFASKAKMFEGLIEFAEDTIFSRINQILEEDKSTSQRCDKIMYLLLGFSERNPGITRVLMGDALVGERGRLHDRVEQFFNRVEAQLKQVLRESALRDQSIEEGLAEPLANLMLSVVEGRMHRFLRSRFQQSPLEQWQSVQLLIRGYFRA